jgi:hypothetical protein
MKEMTRIAANTSSIRFSAAKTSRPIPTPITVVTPGAWNLRGVSIKERPKTNPAQMKAIPTCRMVVERPTFSQAD